MFGITEMSYYVNRPIRFCSLWTGAFVITEFVITEFAITEFAITEFVIAEFAIAEFKIPELLH